MLLPILPIPLIILQILTLSIAIAIEGIILQQKLRLTRKQSIEFSIAINLWSTIILWLFFFAFDIFAPESEKLHLIALIFFNNIYGINRQTVAYIVLTTIAIMMFALIVFVEFKALQLFQAIAQILAEQNTKEKLEYFLLINQINEAIVQADASMISAVFQANLLSHIIMIAVIVFLNIS